MNDVIETQNLSRFYGLEDIKVLALKNINLKIQKGEFTAIVGPSGSGKTTLLNLIGGLDTPSEGLVKLDGVSLGTMTGNRLSDFRRDHIGFVFQSYNLIPVLTVEENIEYVMLLQSVPEQQRHERVHSILQKLKIEDKKHRYPNQLSGGQQQRVAIARAMVSAPALILADEPTANLDSQTGSELLDMMRELNEKDGMTFVFSTHDPMIMSRAKRLIELHDGKITKDETR